MERLEILKTRAKSAAMSGLLSLFCVSLILASVAIDQDKGEQWERPKLDRLKMLEVLTNLDPQPDPLALIEKRVGGSASGEGRLLFGTATMNRGRSRRN